MPELFAGGDNAMSIPIQADWLFQGLLNAGLSLEDQTPILAQPQGRITRWTLDSFPLRVWTQVHDYDLLQSNLLSAQLYQTLSEITAIHPDLFQFAEATTPEAADIVFQFTQAEPEDSPLEGPHPLDHIRIGPEGQLRRVELWIPITQPGNASSRLVTVSALRALGLTASAQPHHDCLTAPLVEPLTAQDRDSLQLLYRCPIALSHRELSLLWRSYQARQASQHSQDDVLDAILNSPPDREAKVLARTLLRRRSSELSMRELTLQESIQSALGQIESA